MSRNIWQINAQSKQYEHGKTCISRAKSYVETWKGRCYEGDIPDEVPFRVVESMRVPSYKAIAMCILNNDLALYGLGFAPHVSHWYKTIKKLNEKETSQMELF